MKIYNFSEEGSYGTDFYVMSDSVESAKKSVEEHLKKGDKYDQETLEKLDSFKVFEYEKDEVFWAERC